MHFFLFPVLFIFFIISLLDSPTSEVSISICCCLVPMVYSFYRKHILHFNNEVKWKDKFKGKIYYSHGKSSSCGVLIAFYSDKVNVKKSLVSKNGHILILNSEIDDCEYILINLYISDVESERLNTIDELFSLHTQLIFTCSNGTIKTLEKGVKYVQN